MEELRYQLFIPDYHNGFETKYSIFAVTKDVFDKDWVKICNHIDTTRFTGLTPDHVQAWMHDNSIYFIVKMINGWDKDRAEKYVNHNEVNQKYCKLVTHNNVGNY